MNKFFVSKKKLIVQEISQLIKNQNKFSAHDYPWAKDALARLEQFSISGKMIRGLLVVLCAGNRLKQTELDAVKIGAALELMHSGILIHDDIMDRDLSRRGNPTIHSQYMDLSNLSDKSEGLHYGESMAICVGIIAYFMAVNQFGRIKQDLSSSQIINLFSSEMSLLGLGQMDDLHTGTLEVSDEQSTLRIYEQKTGRYTFGLPISAGLILAGKYDKKVAKLIQQLSKSLGIIFQLRDDYLGVFGDQSKTGKSVGGDIRERKKTWLYFRLLKAANKKDQDRIKALYLSQKTIRKIDQSWVLSKMEEAGIPLQVGNELSEQQRKSLLILNKLPFSVEQKNIMTDLIDYLVVREK